MNVNTRRSMAKPARPIGEVRIIGGTHKRSKLAVLDRPGLRPTPDRVRETLFNWLAPSIAGARVLDLYAGTGVLALEALSRGAAYAWLNEPDLALAEQIESNGKRLQLADRMHLSRSPAQVLLAKAPEARFDLILVDPPYAANAWVAVLQQLPPWLAPQGLVYMEHPAEIEAPIASDWQVHKQARSGRVCYYLLTQHAVST